MGKIKIHETASNPSDFDGLDNKRSDSESSTGLIMPIEHYVNISAKVENPEANVSVEGVKSAPRKKKTEDHNEDVDKARNVSARKKALALPAGSIGAAVIEEKAKTEAKQDVAKPGMKKTGLAVDGMVKPRTRKVEVTEIEPTAEEEFEAHRPREKKDAEEPKDEGKPKFSKPKAILIGVGVALIVAIIGGVVIGLFSHKETPHCLVQFESNGGSKIESEEVVCGETVAQPVDPTKDGFKFQNWIYAGTPFDFERMTVDEDIILVAKWQVEEGVETVDVHFDANGGVLAEGDKATIQIRKGKTISEPVEPTRTSFEFKGWQLDGEDFDFSTPIEEDITLVATWEAVAGGSSSENPTRPSTSKPDDKKPSVESLSAGDKSVKAGDTVMVDVTVAPKNADYKLGVSYSTNDIVSCSVESGARLKCVAKNVGETTVTVRDIYSGKTGQFKVRVTSDVTWVSVSKNALALTVGESDTLVADVTANSMTGVTVSWKSSNSSVATVTDGKVTAIGVGTATITVTAGGMSDTCMVTVSAAAEPEPDPEPDPEPEPDPDDTE